MKIPKELDRIMAELYNQVFERFFLLVQYSDDCWNWTGYKTEKGYGKFGINYRAHLAHRLSYEYFIEPIPKGLFVCHHCDNPSCVNPFHLFVGTNRDNMIDMYAKGRGNPPNRKLTHCKYGHPFAGDNLVRLKDGSRNCRICKNRLGRIHDKKRRDRKRNFRKDQARAH